MSNRPMIYGFSEAGSKYRVPHYDEAGSGGGGYVWSDTWNNTAIMAKVTSLEHEFIVPIHDLERGWYNTRQSFAEAKNSGDTYFYSYYIFGSGSARTANVLCTEVNIYGDPLVMYNNRIDEEVEIDSVMYLVREVS